MSIKMATLSTTITESRGTGTLSLSYRPKGYHAMQCEPFCHSIGSATYQRYCANCFSELDGVEPLRCSKCKFNRYCNRRCQQDDWPVHKGECPGMAAIHPQLPSDTMRFVLRILAKISLEKTTSPGKFPYPLNQLCSNIDRIPEKKKAYFLQQIEGVERLAVHSKAITSLKKEMLYELLCKLSCNTFSILDDSLNTLGEGVYAMASWINHLCRPNCVVVFEGLTLHVHMTQDTPADQTCELYISYVDLLDTRSKRQKALLDGWYFTCHCSRCTEACSLDHLLTSLKCPHCSKPVLENTDQWAHHDISLCNCKDAVKVERDKEVEDCEQVLKTAQKMKDEGDYSSLLKHCQAMEPVLAGSLSEYHYIRIRMLEHVMDAAIELEQWELAFIKGKSLIPYYRLFLGTSPVTSVHLLKVAKLGRLLEGDSLRESHALLQKAEADLLLTHGENHPLMRTTRELLMDQPFKMDALD